MVEGRWLEASEDIGGGDKSSGLTLELPSNEERLLALEIDFSIEVDLLDPLEYRDGIFRSASDTALSRVWRSRIFLDKDFDLIMVGESVRSILSDCTRVLAKASRWSLQK